MWGHALIILVVGFLIVNILWYPLGLPAYLLNILTKWIGPSDCIQYTIGTGAAQRCALTVGLKVVLGPVIVGVVMFLLRKRIGAQLKRVEAKVPIALRPAFPCLVALILFTMGWAAIHWSTANAPGLPMTTHERFPILVGLVTWVTQSWGKPIQAAAPGFFRGRAKIPLLARIGIVSGVTIVFAYALMKIGSSQYLANPGLKEQIIVLFALMFGWAMMAPVAVAAAAAAVAAPPAKPAMPLRPEDVPPGPITSPAAKPGGR